MKAEFSVAVCAALAALSCHHRARSAPPEPSALGASSSGEEEVRPAPDQATAAPLPTTDDAWGCGLPADLRARGWPKMLSELEAEEPPPPPAGGFSLVVLPDTQYYVACQSDHLARQVRYVLDHLEQQNIVLVLTVGDLTDHNSDTEWAFFHQAVAPLFERVSLVLTTGNHDHGEEGA